MLCLRNPHPKVDPFKRNTDPWSVLQGLFQEMEERAEAAWAKRPVPFQTFLAIPEATEAEMYLRRSIRLRSARFSEGPIVLCDHPSLRKSTPLEEIWRLYSSSHPQ